jgi:L-malate glycosyltransferase
MGSIALAGTAAYAATVLLFGIATYFEGWDRRDGWDRDRVFGLVCCLLGPLLILIVFVYARALTRRQGPARAFQEGRIPAASTADPKSKRILVVNSFANSGGSQQATLRLARQLRLRGHDAEALFLYRKGPLFSPGSLGVPVSILVDKPALTIIDHLKLPFFLFRLFRNRRPDAVITFLPFASGVAQPIAFLSGVRRRIASQRVPGSTYSIPLKALDRLWGTVGIFTEIICVSEAVRDSFESYPGPYRRRLRVVHNGIEWAGTKTDRNAARQKFGLSKSDFCVAAIGRLCEQKNFGLAIMAVMKTSGTRLLIAGDGPDRKMLEKQALALGVADRVDFLGNQPAERVAELFVAGDAFILPSLFEGQSNALLEAMHAGLPIVASDIEMQRETLRLPDGDFAGLLLPLDDAERWAEALARLRDNAQLRHQLSHQAERLVNDRFDLGKMVTKFEDIIMSPA